MVTGGHISAWRLDKMDGGRHTSHAAAVLCQILAPLAVHPPPAPLLFLAIIQRRCGVHKDGEGFMVPMGP